MEETLRIKASSNLDEIQTSILKIEKWSKIGQASSNLLMYLVNDILDLAWLENSNFKINNEEIDIEDIVAVIN